MENEMKKVNALNSVADEESDEETQTRKQTMENDISLSTSGDLRPDSQGRNNRRDQHKQGFLLQRRSSHERFPHAYDTRYIVPCDEWWRVPGAERWRSFGSWRSPGDDIQRLSVAGTTPPNVRQRNRGLYEVSDLQQQSSDGGSNLHVVMGDSDARQLLAPPPGQCSADNADDRSSSNLGPPEGATLDAKLAVVEEFVQEAKEEIQSSLDARNYAIKILSLTDEHDCLVEEIFSGVSLRKQVSNQLNQLLNKQFK